MQMKVTYTLEEAKQILHDMLAEQHTSLRCDDDDSLEVSIDVSNEIDQAFAHELGENYKEMIDTIIPKLNVEHRTKLIRDINTFMKHNEKIEAIKFIRKNTNCGLKEAKDFAEHSDWWPDFVNTGIIPTLD